MPSALFKSEFLIIWRMFFLEKRQLANKFPVSKVNSDVNTLLSAKKEMEISLSFLKINNLLVKNFALVN